MAVTLTALSVGPGLIRFPNGPDQSGDARSMARGRGDVALHRVCTINVLSSSTKKNKKNKKKKNGNGRIRDQRAMNHLWGTPTPGPYEIKRRGI